MCDGNSPTDMLYEYHRSVAAGGIGMTTLAYASVTRNGLSFPHQLWLRPEIVPGLAAHHRRDPPQGSRRRYPDRPLRQHVAPRDLRLHADLGLVGLQHLLPHPRARHAHERNRRRGPRFRHGRKPGPRSRVRLGRSARRARIPDQPVPVALHEPPQRRIRRHAREPDAFHGHVPRRGADGGPGRPGRRREDEHAGRIPGADSTWTNASRWPAASSGTEPTRWCSAEDSSAGRRCT